MKKFILLFPVLFFHFSCEDNHKTRYYHSKEKEIATCGVNDDSNIMPPAIFLAKCTTCHSLLKNATWFKIDWFI